MTSTIADQVAQGRALLARGQAASAAEFFRNQLRTRPDAIDFHIGLADAHHVLGQLEAAIRAYRDALRLQEQPILHGRLGIALCQLGRLAEGAAAFRAALALAPTFIEARSNLGMALLHLGDAAAGETCIRQALALQPDHADSWQIQASAAYSTGNMPVAYAASRRITALAPAHGPALALRALSARQLERLAEAATMSRRAAALDPFQAEMLATAAVVQRDIGRPEDAVRFFRRGLSLQPNHAEIRAALVMCLNYVATATPADLLAEAREWGRRHGTASRARPTSRRTSHNPLRVGLVSGDFRRHPVGYFLDRALSNLDPGRIAATCFSTGLGEDAFTARLKGAAAGWFDISLINDEDAFDLIASQEIDLLIDLSGFTAGGRLRLFSLRPAPVQAAWIGYFGTTGLPAIDWLIADRHLVPESADRWYSERILRLPHSYVCYAPPHGAPPVAPPPSDLTGNVTFGSCNALAKMTPPTIALWAEILVRVPDSRLLLKTGAFDTAEARRNTVAAFAAHGIAPHRILLEGWSAYDRFLDVYARIDIALDPFPFCGGLTTVETLWMGVPLVSLAADRFCGRQSLGYLSTIGHADLCTETPEDYVRRATGLAADAGERRRLRATLRDDMARSPLLDGPRFAADLSAAFERIAGR
jgi:protein O-GlcNAc transferase